MLDDAPTASPHWPASPHLAARLARLGLGLAAVAVIAWYLVGHRDDLGHLRTIPPTLLPLLIALRAAGAVVLQGAGLLCLQIFAPELGFAEYIYVVGAGIVADSFVPLGGLSSKALYLHRRHRVTPGQLISAMAYQGALRLIVGGVIAALGLLLLSGLGHPVVAAHGLLVATSLLFGLGPLLLLGPLSRLGARVRLLDRFAEGWRALRRRPGLTTGVTSLATISTLATTLSAAMLWAAMVPQAAGFLVGGTISAMVSALYVVRLTPGNYGTMEGSVGMLARSFGIPVSFGAVLTVISRLLGLAGFLVVVVGATAHHRLRRGSRITETEPPPR